MSQPPAGIDPVHAAAAMLLVGGLVLAHATLGLAMDELPILKNAGAWSGKEIIFLRRDDRPITFTLVLALDLLVGGILTFGGVFVLMAG